MLFSSPLFLFLFFPLATLCVLAAPRRARAWVLLGASFLFYWWGEPTFALLAIASALADYLIGMRVYAAMASPQGGAGRRWLALGVTLNLGLLGVFKYFDFFIDNLNRLLAPAGGPPIAALQIALPIGVSFIVFEKISYLVDISRGLARPAARLRDYLLFVLFFPKLLAGPIVKYRDFAPQLGAHNISVEDVSAGFARFLLGLAKKVLIADSLGHMADQVFGLHPGQLGFGYAWLGLACFTLQIFLDFSAYSDMAIGMARMFGFRLMENFNRPYLAQSFTDFWRRWHISLSTWIRDYLYLPLGGNRLGAARTAVNLWICFLLSGLWHGAQWTFVLWGAYHGLMLSLDKLFWLKAGARLPRVLRTGITLFLLTLGWAIFRASSLEQLQAFAGSLFDPARHGQPLYVSNDVWFALAAATMVSLAPAALDQERLRNALHGARLRPLLSWAVAGAGLLAIGKTVTVVFHPFLYFRF